MALNRTGRHSLFGKRNGPAAPTRSIAWRALVIFSMVFSIVAGILVSPNESHAAATNARINTIYYVTRVGSGISPTVWVPASTSIPVNYQVTDNGSGSDLDSRGWRVYRQGQSPGAWNCTNDNNIDNETEDFDFDFTSDASEGVWTIEVGAWNNAGCPGTPNTSDTDTITIVIPDENPPANIVCGMDIILVLDESNSIQSALGGGGSIEDTVESAAYNFVLGLQDTGTHLSVIEFGNEGRQAEIGGTTDWQYVDSNYVANFFNYIEGNGNPPETDSYDPISDANVPPGQWTNWEDAFRTVANIADFTPGQPPLVVFFTDGDPTAVGDPFYWGGPVTPSSVAEQTYIKSAPAAVVTANAVKAMDRHIFVVGVPNPGLDTGRVQMVSGTTSYASNPSLEEADYITLQSQDLGAIFNSILSQLCGVEVVVTKKLDHDNDPTTDPVIAGADWQFNGAVNVPSPDGVNFEWLSPVESDNTGAKDGTTGAGGTVTFGWQYTELDETSQEASRIVITETPQDEYYLTDISCVLPNGDPVSDDDIEINMPLNRVTLDNLPISSSRSCTFVNTRKPRLQVDASCDNLADEDQYIEGSLNVLDEFFVDNPVQARDGWKLRFDLPASVAGQLKFEGPGGSSSDRELHGFTSNIAGTSCTISDMSAECTLPAGTVLPPTVGLEWWVRIYIDQLVGGKISLDDDVVTAENTKGEQALGLTGTSDIGVGRCTGETPITLASFKAVRGGDMVRFEWSTATEVGNVGFNLYAESEQGRVQINEQLIPSNAGDSMEPQDYTLEVPAPGDTFYLEDVDILGRTVLRGPFDEGVEYGHRAELEPIDWESIRSERAAKARERAAADNAAVNTALDRIERLPADGGTFKDQYDFTEVDNVDDKLFLPTVGSTGPRAAGSISTGPEAPPVLIAKLQVRETGIYRVTFEQLRDAGLNVKGIRSEALALTNKGQPVPIRVYSPAAFGPGAFIEFYGEALDTIYTDTNVYVLQTNRSLAKRVGFSKLSEPENTEPVQYYMETVEVDRNLAYAFQSPTGDPWFNTSMLVYRSPGTWSYGIEIDHYVPGAAPVQLMVDMFGSTDIPDVSPDHRVVVGFNDAASLSDTTYDGVVHHPVELTLPEGALREGENTLKITLPADTGAQFDITKLDKFSVTYPRAFVAKDGSLQFTAAGPLFRVSGLPTESVEIYRITGSTVVRLGDYNATQQPDGSWQISFAGAEQESTYVVMSTHQLLTPSLATIPVNDITSGSADYLMISHPDFIDGLAPLVQYHQGRGLNVRVVDVRDIYVQFGHGIFDPAAIHEYIKYAAQNMGIQIVLLVGGDIIDYREFTGTGGVSFIPSLYSATSAIVRFAPVDPLFADVDGDEVPDLQIGRFPVRNSAELAMMINKTLTYAGKSYGATAIFAADQNFSADSSAIAAQLPNSWNTEFAHIDDLGVAAAKSKLIGKLEEGVAMASYIGHSSPSLWSYMGLFNANEAAALKNAGRPTVVTQWGCWNTYYVDPAYNSMAHKFLVSGENGAAAVMGATGLTLARSERKLGTYLTPHLTEPGTTIGEAMLEAKTRLAAVNPELKDVILGWTLLGDPALQIVPE